MMSDPAARRRYESWVALQQGEQEPQQPDLPQPVQTAQPAQPAPAAAPTQPKPKPKPMKSPRLDVTPSMLSIFDDNDDVLDFIDSLNDQELRIMERNCDNPDVIKRLKVRVRSDIEETAKDLAIDD